MACSEKSAEILLQLVGVGAAEMEQNLEAFSTVQLFRLPGVREEKPVRDPHHGLNLLHELRQVEAR